MAVGYAIESMDRSAATGNITITTVEYHPFKVGDKVRLYNVLGGGAYPFMASNPYTIGSVTTQSTGFSSRFRVNQPGANTDALMLTSSNITSGTQYASSTNYIQITTADVLGLQVQPRIKISGVTSPVAGVSDLLGYINRYHQMNAVQVVNGTTLVIRLDRAAPTFTPGGSALNWTAGKVEYVPTGAVVALDDGINVAGGRIGGIGITTNQARFYRLRNEGQIVQGVLGLAANSKGIDYPFLRLFDATDSSKLTKNPLKQRITINTAAAPLRSALDSVIEAYQGVDLKKRRYYINPDGQLVYEITTDAQPAFGNAPYKIITTGAGTPNTSTAAASVAPYSLTVGWDHDTTKRALFTTTSRSGAPMADLIKSDSPDALGTAYKRLGAPYFDDAVDYPTGAGDSMQSRQQAAKAYFLERHAPVLSGQFTLRGAGTATWNNLGFTSGYAQVVSTTFNRLEPGAELLYPVSRSSNVATFTTYPFTHNFVPGMQVVIDGITGAGFAGTFTISGTTSTSFTYASVGATASGQTTGDASATAYGLFVRTGTAPSQIVTVTLPLPHGIATGATTVVSGLTGTAGSTMNGTATATVVDNYSFTYPSTGTNGTATGIGTVSSFTLIPRWEPGQWVDVAAAELGLSGLYRVEQVDWRLEPGSFQQIVTVTFNRRSAKTLTKLIKEGG